MPDDPSPFADHALEARIRRARIEVASPQYRLHVLQERMLGAAEVSQLGSYTLLRPLGEGAMGVVYEAIDRKRDQRVALKVVRDLGPGTAQLLKREFRALSGVTHPNLVIFYDLYVRPRLCYFTMELVEGTDFVRYTRAVTSSDHTLDRQRLREALLQLASAIHALHTAGKIHRDLKPSNVLVGDRDGRVVVLDFGLVTTAREGWKDATFSGQVVGTPAYMAPEQFMPGPLTPASDCYAIGAMLYHALVGVPPFRDVRVEHAARVRATQLPEFPEHLRADDLSDLCRSLLHPEPAARPDCQAILAQLAGSIADAKKSITLRSHDELPFVGRQADLAALHDALKAAEECCVAVAVAGVPGIGKTQLLQRFLNGLDPARHVVLMARCHEHESLPYKTLDGVIDALVQYLRPLSSLDVTSLLPRYIAELALMFPALGRVELFASAARGAAPITDQHEHKRRAVSALRELLARIADRTRLVIWTDDLQWGDRDSVAFIRELLTSPDAPACLCIGAIRLLDDTDNALAIVRGFLGSENMIGSQVQQRAVKLTSLAEAEAKELALALLHGSDEAKAEQIAREAEGNPHLICQLAEFAGTEVPSLPGEQPASLETMLAVRTAQLSPAATEVLHLVAVAGSAVAESLARVAAGLGDDVLSAVHELKAARLIRTEGAPGVTRIEIYHRRLRGIVLNTLEPAKLRDLHAKLASALAQLSPRQEERVARHLRRAGRMELAALHLIDLATRATRAFAYERAAQLYMLALKWGVPALEVHRVKAMCADALRSAGRRADAARFFLEAAEAAPEVALAFELRHRAAQELTVSGQARVGRELLGDVMDLPRSRFSLLFGLCMLRLQVALRHLRAGSHEAPSVPSSELLQLDTEWVACQALLMTDPVLWKYLQSRHMLRALKAGEPTRAVRALAMEAMCASSNLSCAIGASLVRTAHLTKEVEAKFEQPIARATTSMWLAASAFFKGDAERALAEAAIAEELFREKCAGVTTELSMLHFVILGAQKLLGHWQEFGRRAQEAIRDVMQRGTLYHSVAIRTHTHLACLVADDCNAADAEVEAAQRGSERDELQAHKIAVLTGVARSLLYRGAGVAAWQHVAELWPDARRSMIVRARFMRVELLGLRGRAAALAFAETHERRFRRAALLDAWCLSRQSFRGATGMAQLILSSIDASDTRTASALRRLERAATSFQNEGLPFFATLARYQSGIVARDYDRAAEAERAIQAAGIKNCAAFVRTYSGHPG